MGNHQHDIQVLRGLVEEYLEVCGDPRFEKNKELWRAHNSLKPMRPLIFVQNFGFWLTWCNEVWNEETLSCKNPFYRMHESALRIELFESEFGDDRV